MPPTPKRKARTRSNGEGSVYQRTDGRWCAALVLDGHRHSFYGQTRREAWDKLCDARKRHSDGLPHIGGELTVGAWLEQWIRTKQARPNSIRAFRAAAAHITEHLGKVPLKRLSVAQVDSFTAAMLESGSNPSSVAGYRKTLAIAIKEAVRRDLVARNVVSISNPIPHERQKPVVLNPEQISRLLGACTHHVLGAMFTTAIMLGLRHGELRGLQWRDVDLEAETLTVCRQRQQPRGGGVGPTKTTASRRVIPLPAIVADVLREHQAEGVVSDYVFLGVRLHPVNEETARKELAAVLAAAGCPKVTPHGLRHSAATALRTAGVDLQTIQMILGHSSYHTTANLYAQISQPLMREAMDRLNETIRTAVKAAVKRSSSPIKTGPPEHK